MFNCKVCGDKLSPRLLHYPKAPGVSQRAGFDETHTLVELDIHQCCGCGLIQIPIEPVSYYRTALRSGHISPEMTQFREDRLDELEALGAKKILDVDAYPGPRIQDAPFDGFYFMQYLEHLPNPNEALRNLRANLVKDAVGIVGVPNFTMILAKGLFLEFTRDHLLYFTHETLAKTLMINGFELKGMKEYMNGYILCATVQRRPLLNLNKMEECRLQLKQEVEAYIGEKRIVIWGASHQTYALMLMLGITDKVEYIIDSNPSKQGIYAPGTFIPIVSPKVLDSYQGDKILVVAGGYNDEITAVIQRTHPTLQITCIEGGKLESKC